jgi:PAS domain S-box-containing protein
MAERSHTSPLVNFRSWEQLVADWPDPVLVFDSDSQRYIVVNDAAVRLLGYSREEIKGLLPGDLSHPDDAREIPAVVAQVEREGSVRRPWRARCKDGTIVDMEMTLTRRQIDGRVVSQSIFRVLGDGLLAGHAAQGGAEERLEVLERTSLAVVALDRDGVVTYWNQGAAERYGLTAGEAIGRQVLDLAHTEAGRASVESLMSHHERRDEWTSRLTINPVAGDPFEALVTGSAIRTDDGELNGFLFVTTPLDPSTRTSSPRMRRARVKCAACGREVTGTMRRKYCSEKCRQWAYYHRHLDAQRERSRQRHGRRRSDSDGDGLEPPSNG